ncbi:hypothetical protein [Roseiconus lacunae]|uniref:DUF4440 domain-containing protein n=1 Tax=Roseiconus lacunae TaxID=2605694 RepID=A0ABT7PSD3_9BACT|nr:hypothetical protein [Roseiconus lacunae]MDM4019420.1 hypothetical protein [Roseiconus lacunae]
MIARPTLLLMLLLSGCQTEVENRDTPSTGESVYQLIVSDLTQKESPDARFVGTEVWVAPQFNEGDSLFYSWGDDIDVDDDLIQSLKQASKETVEFPAAEQFGPNARVTDIESFHDLHYYGENNKPIAAKCLVQFWRPGYSDDGKRAVVRFYYGPSPHGAAGTYVLRYADGEWRIVASTISYYA